MLRDVLALRTCAVPLLIMPTTTWTTTVAPGLALRILIKHGISDLTIWDSMGSAITYFILAFSGDLIIHETLIAKAV